MVLTRCRVSSATPKLLPQTRYDFNSETDFSRLLGSFHVYFHDRVSTNTYCLARTRRFSRRSFARVTHEREASTDNN